MKLRLCEWLDKVHEAGGCGDEVWGACLSAAAEEWTIGKAGVKKIYEDRSTWQEQCKERGVSATGLLAEEAQLPEFLRKNRSGGGVVKRAATGGRGR